MPAKRQLGSCTPPPPVPPKGCLLFSAASGRRGWNQLKTWVGGREEVGTRKSGQQKGRIPFRTQEDLWTGKGCLPKLGPSQACLDTPQALSNPRLRFPKYLSAKLLIPGLWHPSSSLRPSALGESAPRCQDVLCGAPAQLPSFFLQDPRVQEKEVPPPLTPGLWQPSRTSSPLTWDPQEVLPECQREHTAGRVGPGKAGPENSLARPCAGTQGNGEPWEGAGMTQGSQRVGEGVRVYFSWPCL